MKYHNPPAVYVDSLQLITGNIERSIQFYCNILGFQVLEQDQRMAKLSADGKIPILLLTQPTNVIPKQDKTTGLYHFALLLPARSDLALLIKHLVNMGIRFGASNHLVSEAIYFDDPDGNGIEVYVDTAPSTWNWNDKLVSMDSLPLDIDNLLSSATQLKQEWSKLPESTIIGHIHLSVSQLTDATLFYTNGLGFETVAEFRDSAVFLSTNRYHHHIALNTWNGIGVPQPRKNSVGLDFFTLVFPDNETLEKAVTNLKATGAVIEQNNNQFMVEDSSGNRIYLVTRD